MLSVRGDEIKNVDQVLQQIAMIIGEGDDLLSRTPG